MKENLKIFLWVILATTAGIALGHMLFTKVEPGYYQNRIEYYTIDSVSNPYKVPLVLKRNKIYLPYKY